MKFYKKLLALLLSLSMVLSGLVVMAEETTTTTQAPVEPKPLASVEFDALRTMGFLADDVAKLEEDSLITRAQFISSLAKIAGYSMIEYSIDEIPFIDVSMDMEAKNAICYFYNSGIINGTSENTFSPNDPITYQQAAKIILDVCGYKEFVKVKYGANLNGYMAMAQYIDLAKNIKIDSMTAPLTADKGVKLLYNAGRTKVLEPSSFEKSDKVSYEAPDGNELLSKGNNIYYSEGLMQSNGIVSLLSTKVDDLVAIINGKNYRLNDHDLTQLIGCNVNFFYKEENNTKCLVWVGIANLNNMLELTSDELATDDSRYSMTKIVHTKNGRNIVENVSAYANIIYNNALYNDASISQLKPSMGKIRLLDNNNDGIYDLVVVEEYKNIFVTGTVVPLGYLTDKYGNSVYLDQYENVKLYKGGKEVNSDNVGTDVVVSVVEDRYKKNLILYVNYPFIQDTLEGISEENDKTVYNFKDVSLKLADSYINRDAKYTKIEPKIGKKYLYYLDKAGKIAELKDVVDNVLDYSLILKAEPSEEAYDPAGTVNFQFLLRNGSISIAKSAKKIKLNGEKNKTGQDVMNYPGLYDEQGNWVNQIVRTTFNDNGELIEIEFAKDNRDHPYQYDEAVFSYDAYVSGGINSNGGVYRLNNRYIMDPSVTTFVKYTDLADLGIDMPYETMSGVDAQGRSGKAKIYDIKANQLPSAMYFETSAKSSWLFSQILVDKVFEKKIDDEYSKVIGCWYGSTYMEYVEYQDGIIPSDLKRGDVIRIALYKQKIVSVKKDISLASKPDIWSTGSYPANGQIFSYIYALSNQAISMLATPAFESTGGKVISCVMNLGAEIPVTIYDVKNDEIKVGCITDVYPSSTPDKFGDLQIDDNTMMALVQWRDSRVFDVILIYY